ncbi:MAG: hypothetical protein B6D68_00610, partial [spirochete symbiont of Stewartia floridana]
MIRIQSNSVVVTIKTSKYRKTIHGHLEKTGKQGVFATDALKFQVRWNDTKIHAGLHAAEEAYIETVVLSFKYKTPKTSSETAIWAESCAGGLFSAKMGAFNRRRGGAWAMWVAESWYAEGLFFGQAPPAKHPLWFQCHPLRQRIDITWLVNLHLSEGQEIVLSEVEISRGKNTPLVENWRKKWVSRFNENKSLDNRKGWLWGNGIVSYRDIHERLNHLKKSKIGIDWFAIGAGYSKAIGDWLETEEGLQGRMHSISRSISEMGIAPGLQFAPYLVSLNSKIAEDNPEWLVSNEQGVPVRVKGYPNHKDKAYVLDATRPEVQQHIKEVFSVMKNRWGFRVFVLDRITDTAILGRRADNTYTSSELIKGSMGLIRKVVGNKGLLVGMTPPLLIAPGIFDIQSLTDGMDLSFSPKALMSTVFALIQEVTWNDRAWINASAPLPIEIFHASNNAATGTLLRAIQLSVGAVIFLGDPRKIDDTVQDDMKNFLDVFKECRIGRLRIDEQRSGQENVL